MFVCQGIAEVTTPNCVPGNACLRTYRNVTLERLQRTVQTLPLNAQPESAVMFIFILLKSGFIN